MKDRASIILSIFKRKGGEGVFTKIVTDMDYQYHELGQYLTDNEKLLIVCHRDNLNWISLSNNRIIISSDGNISSILYTNIKYVKLALEEEYKNGVKDKNRFSLLKIGSPDREYVLDFEEGKPLAGIYQVLHFLVN